MIDTEKKGCRELLIQRMTLAVITSVMLQLFVVCCVVLLTNLSTDYAHWLEETWIIVMSPRMWAYIIVLTMVTFLQSFFCSKNYLRPPLYYKSRFAKLCMTLRIQSLLQRALYIVIGGILVWLQLSLRKGSYSSLTTDSSNVYGTYPVEEYYFLLFSGLWSGLYFSFKTDSFAEKYFQFPIIAQSKFFQLRRRFYTMFPTLMISSMWSTLYFMAIYYFMGSYFREALLPISMQMEVKPLDTVSRLLNLSLIWQLWLYQFIFMLITNNTNTLFEIYLTEWAPFKFGLSGAYTPDSSETTLIDVLSMDKIPIMQHLGYLDLVTLAQKEQMRRSMLFTLSQPGGHPYNWNCVVQKSTNLLEKFSLNLNAISTKSQDQSCYSTLTARVPPVQQSKYIYHMRKLVPDTAPISVSEDAREVPYSGSFIQKFIKQKKDAFIAYLLSKPFINYIFGEQDDNKIRYALQNGQLVIWAAEAISSLTVFSLSEDSYGIVQKDVPVIINTLLSVKQALDKLSKSAMLARKMQADDKLIREIFTSLRSTIKRSLYKIVTNFEPYINDLSLELPIIEQLQGFLNYKE
ncbi:PREDICTED: nucleoporin NDC1 [Trachymyrmex cornetzi]|uniref:Nucleoporin Ndc1 n=1 Tax=Trachymyrmex cornetzi TaxID=471704 RepID=A0A195DWT1_9HYME|nr:PREDICTED: nucleoporin NDC1 [Trachymyrmex cornetzi]KYN17365.1 Nucleoporin Ndc1 [Trachymyrmex cornetzi]